MGSYYSEKQKANIRIANIIHSGRNNKQELNINRIVYEVTKNFQVGELTVIKRIKLLQSIEEDFDIVGDTIVFKQKN